MVSLRRRQVTIALLGGMVAPAVFAALPKKPEQLVLSGRILGLDGKPLAGATIASGLDQAVTDADGRFLLVTTTRLYGVTCDGHPTEGIIANQRRDIEGTWRATCGLTLA
jgi:hypothetical protein